MADCLIDEKLKRLSVECDKENIIDNCNSQESITTKKPTEKVEEVEENEESIIPTVQSQRKVYARLHLFNRDGSVKKIVEMKKTKFIIGSDEDLSDILITRSGVYPKHAEIIYDKEKRKFFMVPLIDPKISDTIRINFVPFINRKEPIDNNDTITIGFRSFRIEFVARVSIDTLIQPEIPFLKQQEQQQEQQQHQPQYQYPLKQRTSQPLNQTKQQQQSPLSDIFSAQPSTISSSNSNISARVARKQAPQQPTSKTAKTNKSTSKSNTAVSLISEPKVFIDPNDDTRNKSNQTLEDLKIKKMLAQANKQTKVTITKTITKTTTEHLSDGDDEDSGSEKDDDEEEDDEEDDEEEEQIKKDEPKPTTQKLSASAAIKQAQSSVNSKLKAPTTAPTKKVIKEDAPITLKPTINKATTTPSITPKPIGRPPKNTTTTTIPTPLITSKKPASKIPTPTVTSKKPLTTTTTTKTTTATTANKPISVKETKPVKKLISLTNTKNIVKDYQKSYEQPYSDEDFKNLKNKDNIKIKKCLQSLSKTKWRSQLKGVDGKSDPKINSLTIYFDSIPKIQDSYSAEFLMFYYTNVENPMSIHRIINQLKDNPSYKLDQVLKDWNLIVENAKIINGIGSECYWLANYCKLELYESLANCGLVENKVLVKLKNDSKSIFKEILSNLPKGSKEPLVIKPTQQDLEDNEQEQEEEEEEEDEKEEEEEDEKEDEEETPTEYDEKEQKETNVKVSESDDDGEYESDEEDDEEEEENNKSKVQFSSDEEGIDNGQGEEDDDFAIADDQDDESGGERDELLESDD